VREVHELIGALSDASKAVREREEALRAADHAKDEFLAMLGHELRNPLSALASSAEILQIAAPKDGVTGNASAIVGRQVRHMARILDDLLDVSRVTSGKVTLSRRPLDLAKVVERTWRDLKGSGRLDEHEIKLDLSSVWIDADEARIEQIVSNLVGNGLKYTPRGGRIEIRVGRQGGHAVLEVSDTGIGLSPELLPRVFDLFFQGEQTIDRASGGLGLGLTLVRRLAELHGGQVTVSSEGVDRGARFTVYLPAIERPADRGPHPTAVDENGEHCRIMLIEDNDDARHALSRALALRGFDVIESADGSAGLEKAAQVEAEVGVIDIGLPGVDGYEVARRLRGTPTGASMLLIAISGYGQADSRQRAMDSGFDEYIIKPVSAEMLSSLILSRAGRRSP
jgi:CheY-like chemotaxis protein/nitrogen-specific signal transduction histidine kinase